MGVCMHVHVYVYVHIGVCMQLYVCVCMYVCACMYVYINIARLAPLRGGHGMCQFVCVCI